MKAPIQTKTRTPSSVTRSSHATFAPIVHELLRSPGRPLDSATRAVVDPCFGHDFSEVRVYTDAAAAAAASAIDADAFTSGHNIVFATEKYAPNSESGQQLLFHELTHVVQQSAGLQRRDKISQPGDAYETQAERVANDLSQARAALLAAPRTVNVNRQMDCRRHTTSSTVSAIQRSPATFPKDESLPEKAQMLLDDIYERELVEYPDQMRDNLQDWIEAMNFPKDAVNKPIADQVVGAFNKNLSKLLIGKVIDAVPNPMLKLVLKLANDVVQDVVNQTVVTKKDYSNLRNFWNSLSDTYNKMAIVGSRERHKFKANTIDFKNEMVSLTSAEQNKIHRSLQVQADSINSTYDAEIGKAYMYFASLYLNSMNISPPASEGLTEKGARKGFMTISYNVDSSPGLIGEKDGKYKFFPKPTYPEWVSGQGYRYIDDREILSVFPQLDFAAVAYIWSNLFFSGKRKAFTANLFSPLAEQLKQTLYDHSGGDVLDTEKLNIRRRVMLNYYATNRDFDEDGNQIGGRNTSNYDEFYWKVMWRMEGFPSIRKDRLYAQDA